jgi:thiamine kinase-like enzyme
VAGLCALMPNRVVVSSVAAGPPPPDRGRMLGVAADTTIAAKLERIPLLAGRHVVVSDLAGGGTNGVFLVLADADRFVVRVPGPGSDLLEIKRADERSNAKAAAGTGIAPAVLDYLEDSDVMVLEYIEGTVPTATDLQTPDQARRIASTLRRLHSGPRFRNEADTYAKTKRWLDTCDRREFPVPGDPHARLPELDEIARVVARGALPAAPCHNDLVPTNFIDDGDQLWLVDFEFSGNNDPSFDVAGIGAEAELDDDLLVILCEGYFGRADAALLARLKLCSILWNASWALYSAIQAAVMTEETYFDDSTSYWNAVLEALDSGSIPDLISVSADSQ